MSIKYSKFLIKRVANIDDIPKSIVIILVSRPSNIRYLYTMSRVYYSVLVLITGGTSKYHLRLQFRCSLQTPRFYKYNKISKSPNSN